MAVNYDVYGQPTSWLNAFYQQNEITNKNKIANFGSGDKTLSSGVTNGKLSYTEPIDNSLSYCGLGTESAMSHVAIMGYADGERKLLNYNDRQVSNFAFFEKSTTTNYTQTDFLFINLLNRTCWTENMATAFNDTVDLSPLTVVNPHNIILYATIEGKADLSHSWTTASLDYVMNNIESLNWRYFNKVKLTAYFGNNTDNVSFSTTAGYLPMPANNNPFIIGLLDKYSCPDKNVEFNMYHGVNDSNVVFGFINQNDITTDTDLINIAYITESAKPHLKISGQQAYIEYYEGMFEDILKTIACFGLYFTGNATVAAAGDLTNSKMYIGLLDSDGIGHGDYLQGADTVRAPQAVNDFTDMHTSGYDPSKPYIEYDSTPHYGTASYESINKMYALTGTQVLQIMSELSDAMSAIPSGMEETNYSTGTFLTNNPIDCIVSLRKYPVYNTAKNTSETYPVMFGGYESQISAPYAKNVQVFRFEFTGSKAFISNFDNSFLDREPYTTADLYIPFCGTVKLSCDEFINHDIGVRLVLDYRTGSALAYIERDGIPQMSIGGDMGLDIPLTGVQTQTLASTIRRNAANLKQAQISAVQAASGGATMSGGDNPLQLVGGMINIANRIGNVNKALLSNEVASYSLHHTEIPFKSISTGDAVTGMSGEWCCRLSITRPVLSPDFDPETYGKTIGYACLKQGKIKKDGVLQFTGLTVGTIDLTGVNAPAEVKTMIQAAFKQGVYL